MVATTAENLQHLTLESSDSIISSGERLPTLAKDMVEAATQARRDIDSIARELEATLAHVKNRGRNQPNHTAGAPRPFPSARPFGCGNISA